MSVSLFYGLFLFAIIALTLNASGCASTANAKTAELPNERPVTGKVVPSMAQIDREMIAFLIEHQIPGASVAVAKDGRLVYARGFGYGDVANLEPVNPDSLFRIASISKSITSVAVLQLVEQGKLALDDKVFDILQVEPWFEPGGNQTLDPRWKTITIDQLLHHTGGWDRVTTFDAMFQTIRIGEAMGKEAVNGGPPAETADIIRFMMGRKLDFDPGSKYVYSNFDYCMLGRVIEKKTGMTYAAYVKRHVLAPVGVNNMEIGRSLWSQRFDKEVRYYPTEGGKAPAVVGPNIGKPVPFGYGTFYQESLDAHGAWISSAADLVRFACAFEDWDKSPLLSKAMIEHMFKRPNDAAGIDEQGQPKERWYAAGWYGRPEGKNGKLNTWHGGSLPGTATSLVRRHDGVTWAVLLNRRYAPGEQEFLGYIFDRKLHEFFDADVTWPTHDLFGEMGYK